MPNPENLPVGLNGVNLNILTKKTVASSVSQGKEEHNTSVVQQNVSPLRVRHFYSTSLETENPGKWVSSESMSMKHLNVAE